AYGKGDDRHTQDKPDLEAAHAASSCAGLPRSARRWLITPAQTPSSAANISPSLYGRPWAATATALATSAATIIGRLRSSGTTMPMKVADRKSTRLNSSHVKI